ncbi:rliB [Symbiodinium natans]|uniref:RliB protein n=1 Tax=Symbiodinium natans TaxID=878477 RepID=A0A812VBZ5_9DINO|nr:rliB [Symbiodinium natans]
MAAEVVNLERSVVITGDHDDFEATAKGLHTISAHGGVMDLRFARVEYCGQRNFMGKYCLHFHHAGQCPDCTFKGNAVYQSAQIGITIHGTHRSLVEGNVMWDTSSAGVYVEDGNEMFNTISNNVIICSQHQKCSTPWDVQLNNAAGIYMIGMTNNLIENRVVGFENCRSSREHQ